MAKRKLKVAQDRASIRKARKAIQVQPVVLRLPPASPEAERDRWIRRHPNIVPIV